MRVRFEPLPPGPTGLVGARPDPDLPAHGWQEAEYAVHGTAESFNGHPPAPFATRALVRRPVDPAGFCGTVVVEWLNVSSGSDVAPVWTYTADELIRQNCAWVGVSAQYIGVHGGPAAVAGPGVTSQGLTADPRHAQLSHPGDTYAHSIFAATAAGLGELLDDLDITSVLAAGESQSGSALTTFINHAHASTRVFDGFLVHSRGGPALPLGEPGSGVDLALLHAGDAKPVQVRADVDVPVLMVQAEGDLFGRLDYLPARQDDSARIRLWEIAGQAHADRFQIGDFEDFLGCPLPVNRGQQAYVLRAALRTLRAWAGGGPAPASVPRIEVQNGAPELDEVGVSRGGLRTPVVTAPVELLRGDTVSGASLICQLFGSTLPLPPETMRALYPDRASYVAAYTAATDAAIAAGHLLVEDRAAILAEMRPDLVDAAHGRLHEV